MWRDRSGTSAGDVFALIHDGLVHTRAEIGRRTDLSRTAVAARVRQLVELGLVVEDAAGAMTGGRPAGKLRVNAAGGGGDPKGKRRCRGGSGSPPYPLNRRSCTGPVRPRTSAG